MESLPGWVKEKRWLRWNLMKKVGPWLRPKKNIHLKKRLDLGWDLWWYKRQSTNWSCVLESTRWKSECKHIKIQHTICVHNRSHLFAQWGSHLQGQLHPNPSCHLCHQGPGSLKLQLSLLPFYVYWQTVPNVNAQRLYWAPWTCTATYSLPGSSKQSQSGDVSKLSMLSSQKKRGLLTLTERRWWKKLRKTGRAGQGWRRRMAARDLCPQTSWKVGFKCYISWTHSHHLMLIIVQVDNGPRSLPSTSAPSPHSPDATTPHQAAQHRQTNQSIIYSNPHASKKPPLRALPRDLNEAILGHPGLKPVNRESLSKEMNEFLVQRRRAVAGVTLSDNIPYTSATSDYDEA